MKPAFSAGRLLCNRQTISLPVLIAMRIYQGLTQRELADKLGVHESQVSRDERNEYAGITVERANRILEALGAELRTNIVKPTRKKSKTPNEESVLVGS